MCKKAHAITRYAFYKMEQEEHPFETRKCTKCFQEKTVTEFSHRKIVCKSCRASDAGRRLRTDMSFYMRKLCSAAMQRAKNKNLPYNLNPDKLIIPKYCPVLNIPIIPFMSKKSASPCSPSIDRIDPTKGYTMDNIKIISHRANTLKNNATHNELRKVLAYIEHPEWF